MNCLDKRICLNLNSVWQPVGTKTVKEAICDLYSGSFEALDIEYSFTKKGYNFDSPSSIISKRWEEWVNLPIRDFDLYVCSSKLKVRVPTVLITNKYSKMPINHLKPTAEGIRKRDLGTCQYSGRKLQKNEGSVDHVLPRGRGGEDTWENLVYCDRKINLNKSNKTPQEAGLKLLKNPKEPVGVYACSLVLSSENADWKHFVFK